VSPGTASGANFQALPNESTYQRQQVGKMVAAVPLIYFSTVMGILSCLSLNPNPRKLGHTYLVNGFNLESPPWMESRITEFFAEGSSKD
jgi:hypothetical protein